MLSNNLAKVDANPWAAFWALIADAEAQRLPADEQEDL